MTDHEFTLLLRKVENLQQAQAQAEHLASIRQLVLIVLICAGIYVGAYL